MSNEQYSNITRQMMVKQPIRANGTIYTALLPKHQISNCNYVNSYFTYQLSEITSTFLSSPSRVQCRIPRGTIPKLKSLTLALNITCSGGSGTYLVPVSYWFQRIDFYFNSSEIIQTLYDVSQQMKTIGSIPNHVLEGELKNMNMDWRQNSKFGQQPLPLAAGEQRTFYLPLPFCAIDQLDLYYKNLNQDLYIAFTVQQEGIVSSGSGTITTNSVNVIANTEILSPDEEKKMSDESKGFAQACVYLDTQWVSLNAKTLNASTTAKFLLDALSKCKLAGLAFVVRSTGPTNTNNGRMQFLNLGDNASTAATVDFVSSLGNSVYGNGQALSTKWLRNELNAIHFPLNDFFQKKCIYTLPFCDSMLQAFQGKIRGYLQIRSDSDKYQLSITPAPAPTSEVHTLTCSTTGNSGYYRLYDPPSGEYSNPLVFSSTAGPIQTALQGMKRFARDNITVVASGVIAGSSSQTLTFSSNIDVEVSKSSEAGIQVLDPPLTAANAPLQITTSVSTNGITGWVSGTNNYDIDCYVFQYKIVYCLPNGKIYSELL